MRPSFQFRNRPGLALLALAAAVGCSSGGTDNNDEGSIALAINPTSASVVQGGTTPVGITLTRSGGFTGTVQFSVTGNPAGVTGVVSNETTNGLVTTATVTVNVGAAVTAGLYPLVVHATGTGVDEATATFNLTVTAIPAAYTLALSAAALSIPAGAALPTTTVNLTRTNFTGNVTLSVEGLPAGVTPAFVPNPATGNSSVLTLTVGAGVQAAVYNLTVRGVATGLTDRTTPLVLTVTPAPAPSYTLSLSAAALTIVQGASTPTTTVNVNRVNFTGDVNLAVTGLPPGVTFAFAPNPATGATSVLTLTVGAAVAPNVYNLTVNGTATAGNQSTPLVLTVVAPSAIALAISPAGGVSMAPGSTNNTKSVTITRTNFTGAITLAAETLPAGLTATFAPNGTTGNTSVVTLTATAATAPGLYNVTIRGTGTGVTDATVVLPVTITSPGGSGNVSVSFAACALASRAVWFAYQDGTAGPWVRVVGVADVYQFNITQSKAGIAYVVLGSGNSSTINVFYFSQAELVAGFNVCGTVSASGKSVTGTVANLPANFIGNVSYGNATTAAFANGAFTLNNVLDGSNDVVGYARPLLGGGGDRMFLARGLNPANGGSIGTVDFTGAGSFAPASATMTLVGAAGGETVVHSMIYYTGTACTFAPLYSASTVSGATFTANGNTGTPATDFNNLSVIALSGATSFRFVSETFHTFAARTFTLPSALGTVTVTNAGGPYKRPMFVTTLPAELNSSAVATFSDQTVAGKGGSIIATAAWLGGLNVSLTLPDFSALAGWSNAWAPATGDTVQWTLSGSGTNITSVCQEGGRIVTSTKSGTL